MRSYCERPTMEWIIVREEGPLDYQVRQISALALSCITVQPEFNVIKGVGVYGGRHSVLRRMWW